MARICIFGDSIAKGHNDYKNGGWATLLGNRLERECNDLSTYNLSISGDTSQNILNRFEIEAKLRNPVGILFAYGINDAAINIKSGKTQINLKKFEENTQKLINICRKYSYKAMFLGPTSINQQLLNPVPWIPDTKYGLEKIEKYHTRLKTICKNREEYFIPLIKLLSNSDLDDGVHPNSQGHKKIFKNIYSFLKDNDLISKLDEN
ncbi:hypothetical protein GF362_01005 [Candidatus Dojkabacteria bacterium]|nr:hypothetical protein [Candidatus Dojkabacteria bacterium]